MRLILNGDCEKSRITVPDESEDGVEMRGVEIENICIEIKIM